MAVLTTTKRRFRSGWARARKLVRQQASLLRTAALAIAGVGVVVLLALLLLKWAPVWLANEGGLKPPEAAAEIGRVRTALLAVIGGSIATAGVVYTARTYSLNREGQITDRFTRATDQLGNSSANVRLGGVFALERIARESPVDREPIIQILIGFLREHSPEASEEDGYTTAPPPSDFQSALDVLTRRQVIPNIPRLDLGRLNMRGADLSNASLGSASFRDANLTSAKLRGASLDGASFFEANLRWASFNKASAQRTWFLGPNLQHASFDDADLEDSWISGDLKGTKFKGANLSGAHLKNAKLAEARLDGARYDNDTRWPDDFDPDAAGAVRA